ncbi:DsbA family protein [Altererythrobacter aquiaggeris]|uniref:DsbA family protein n=1 Tax=Aestuarierythrobacter aquiaggeris TaxID=1898396 RepID=UPI003017CA81
MSGTASLSGKSMLVAGAIALVCGFGGAAIYGASGIGGDKAEIRSYLLENPEILPEMVARLEAREVEGRLASAGPQASQPFPGAVMGNPGGSITLVEFSDYSCGYCRGSMQDVQAIIAANPDLKVVVRELPILSPASEAAARMALAAAKQGKYAAFHKAMFEGGRPDPVTIKAAAAKAGMDYAKAEEIAMSPDVSAEISRNLAIAQQLGFDGTPSWIIGDKVFQGAVGQAQLQQAIKAARES